MSQNDDHIGQGAADSSQTLASAKPLYELGSTIGAYKLLSVLGEGGFGVVYLAEQEYPIKRLVALKVIKPGMDTRQVIARFETERQALAMLDHPNIAQVFDAGATEAGRPYFAMEYVKGIPITEYCDLYKLGTQERLRLFIPLCQGIQHAHQKGIIHRDIKPSNALVMLHDEKPIPKIIDFGVAKALNQRLTERTLATEKGEFIGTPEYMSPEQAELTGLDVDTRTDIYSLGVLLYELLTGSTPFDAQDLRSKGYAEMQRIICEQDPVKPSTRLTTLGGKLEDTARQRSATVEQLRKSVRGDLDSIVMKTLEKNRARRYGTAQALAEDIERHLNHQPVVARPPSTVYRVQKFVRRNKVIVGALAAVAAVLVLGILVSTWQAARAKSAEQRAETEAGLARQAEKTAREETRIAEAERRRAEEGERSAERLLYVANMNLTQQAWEQDTVGRVRQLLEETAGYPERGFEWYYWQRQTHLELKTLCGHSDGVLSVAFSPDGQRIVTCSNDRTAKVWEAASGKELLTLKGHSSWVWSVAFSPDGQRIVTGSSDHTAKVWEAATAQQVAVWQREERAASERAVVLRREQAAAAEHARVLRAHDLGAIKRWLLLAPIPFEGSSGAAAVQQEQIPQEANLLARTGKRVKVGQSERVWSEVQLEDYVIDFNPLLGAETKWSVAYAVCYIQSEVDQAGLVMRVGSDDQAKIYLNGKEIYRSTAIRAYVPEQDVVEGVDLKAGLNVLVFKVVNETGDWEGSVRFTDAAGQPVKGIRVTSDPEAKD